jgi:hypothetical protein
MQFMCTFLAFSERVRAAHMCTLLFVVIFDENFSGKTKSGEKLSVDNYLNDYFVET